MRKFRTIRRQPESARWRREYVDKLSGDPFNPKPKTSMAVGPGELPVALQWCTRTSPNVNVDEAPGDRAPEPAATQRRWYVTEALVKEHGRTMGCPRCSSGIGIHNAECRARIEGILLQQSRMKPAEVDEPREWSHNDEISANGVGEANKTCASRRQQRVWNSARRCHQSWGDEKC